VIGNPPALDPRAGEMSTIANVDLHSLVNAVVGDVRDVFGESDAWYSPLLIWIGDVRGDCAGDVKGEVLGKCNDEYLFKRGNEEVIEAFILEDVNGDTIAIGFG